MPRRANCGVSVVPKSAATVARKPGAEFLECVSVPRVVARVTDEEKICKANARNGGSGVVARLLGRRLPQRRQLALDGCRLHRHGNAGEELFDRMSIR